jgi:transmembrane sensor
MKRRTSQDFPDATLAIEKTASEWLGLRDAGLTNEQARAFREWLSADERHATAFAWLDSTSRALDQLEAFRPREIADPDPELPLRTGRVESIASRWWRSGLVALGIAAALAIAWLGPWQRTDPLNFHQRAATEIGGLKKINLPDGSVLDLNTDTAVTITFEPAQRRVELTRGEAHFAVAEDALRPFVVQIGGIRVQAVGTAFSVRLRPQGVEVLVSEGKVGVHDARRDQSLLPDTGSAVPPVLAAGQCAIIASATKLETIAPTAAIAEISPVEIAQKLAWQEKRLEFGPTPLKTVVEEFNRYSVKRLVVADSALATINIGGTFRAGDEETLLRLLESNFDVLVERRGQDILLRRR